MTRAKYWSEVDRARLAHLAEEGRSIREVAVLMDRSEMAIEAKARSLNLKLVRRGRSKSLKRASASSPFDRVFGR